jgi:hypothetical protein
MPHGRRHAGFGNNDRALTTTMSRFLLVLALGAIAVLSVDAQSSQTITTIGQSIVFVNSTYSLSATVTETVSGAPNYADVIIYGCPNAGQCTQIDDNLINNGATSATRNLSVTTVYPTYAVRASWAGGSSVTVTASVVFGSASTGGTSGGSSGGGSASAGSGVINSGTANQITYYAANGTTVSADARLTDQGTNLNYTGTSGIYSPIFQTTGTAAGSTSWSAGTGNIPALPANSAGFAGPASGGTSYLFKMPAAASAGVLYAAAPAANDGVNESALSFKSLQGTDASILTAGTISGTGATLCTDANGGATTTGCASGGGSGSGIVNNATALQLAFYQTTGTAVSGDSRLTDSGTSLGYSGVQGMSALSFNTTNTTPGAAVLVAGSGSITALPSNSAGFAAPASGGTSYLVKMPATAQAGMLYLAAPATNDGVNEAALTVMTPTTFSGLVTCNSANEGRMRPVTDSTVNTWGSTIAGGGTNHVLAYCNSSAWTVAAK